MPSSLLRSSSSTSPQTTRRLFISCSTFTPQRPFYLPYRRKSSLTLQSHFLFSVHLFYRDILNPETKRCLHSFHSTSSYSSSISFATYTSASFSIIFPGSSLISCLTSISRFITVFVNTQSHLYLLPRSLSHHFLDQFLSRHQDHVPDHFLDHLLRHFLRHFPYHFFDVV